MGVLWLSTACLPTFPEYKGDGSGGGDGTDGSDGSDGAETDADSDGWAAPEDCNDFDPGVHPGATERCGGVDENCDGQVDEADAEGCTDHGVDEDGDGYGAPDGAACLCAPAEPHTADSTDDCDDSDPDTHPGRELRCQTRHFESCDPEGERAACHWNDEGVTELADGAGARFKEGSASGGLGLALSVLVQPSAEPHLAIGRSLSGLATAGGKPGTVVVYPAPLAGETNVEDGVLAAGQVQAIGRDAEDGFGRSVLLHPDLDGSGVPDLVVFSEGFSTLPGDSYFGVVPDYVDGDAEQAPKVLLELPTVGRSIRGAGLIQPGDLDEDGLADLIVTNAAPLEPSSVGLVWIVSSPVTESLELSESHPDVRLLRQDGPTGLGTRVVAADSSTGRPVVVVAEPGTADIAGRAHVFEAAALAVDAVDLSDGVTLTSREGGTYCSWGLALADFTGDGYLELAVGCPAANDINGVVYVFDRDTISAIEGSAEVEALATVATFTDDLDGEVTGLGFNLSPAGDVDLVPGDELVVVGINGGATGPRFLSTVSIGTELRGTHALPDPGFSHEVYADDSGDDLGKHLVGGVPLTSGDLVPDLVVGQPADDGEGMVFVLPGLGP